MLTWLACAWQNTTCHQVWAKRASCSCVVRTVNFLQAFSLIAWPVNRMPSVANHITACSSTASVQETRAVEEHGCLLPLSCGWLRLVRPAVSILSHAVQDKASAGAFWESRQAEIAATCLQHNHSLPLPACLSACSTCGAGPCLPNLLQHSPQSACPLQNIVHTFPCLPACSAAPSLCKILCVCA